MGRLGTQRVCFYECEEAGGADIIETPLLLCVLYQYCLILSLHHGSGSQVIMPRFLIEVGSQIIQGNLPRSQPSGSGLPDYGAVQVAPCECRRACALCVGVSGRTEKADEVGVLLTLRIWGCIIPPILEPQDPERLGLRFCRANDIHSLRH